MWEVDRFLKLKRCWKDLERWRPFLERVDILICIDYFKFVEMFLTVKLLDHLSYSLHFLPGIELYFGGSIIDNWRPWNNKNISHKRLQINITICFINPQFRKQMVSTMHSGYIEYWNLKKKIKYVNVNKGIASCYPLLSLQLSDSHFLYSFFYRKGVGALMLLRNSVHI